MVQKIDNKYKRGWDRLNPDLMGTVSYNASTQTFSVAVTGGQTYFEFWANGYYFQKTTTQSVVWDDVTGSYYFYFDSDGVLQFILQENMTQDIFLKSAICGLCYWNATLGEIILEAKDEQHGIIMDASTHFYEHLTRGFAWAHGVEINGLANGSDTYTNTGSGLAFDEDIPMMFAEAITHPFIYRSGATGEWVQTTVDNKCAYVNSGDTDICYNQFTGGTWQLTEATNITDYIIYMIIGTNDKTNPIKKVIGHQAYSSASNARKGMRDELKAIRLDGFPGAEIEFYYAYIVDRDGEIVLDSNGEAYVDLRGIPLNSLNN